MIAKVGCEGKCWKITLPEITHRRTSRRIHLAEPEGISCEQFPGLYFKYVLRTESTVGGAPQGEVL